MRKNLTEVIEARLGKGSKGADNRCVFAKLKRTIRGKREGSFEQIRAWNLKLIWPRQPGQKDDMPMERFF